MRIFKNMHLGFLLCHWMISSNFKGVKIILENFADITRVFIVLKCASIIRLGKKMKGK